MKQLPARPRKGVSHRVPFLAIILGVVSVLMICFLWTDNAILAVLFLMMAVPVLVLRRRYLTNFMLAAIIGTSMETVCIIFGAWSYSNPTFIIPIWLPIGWGIAGVIFSNIMEFVSARFNLSNNRVRMLPLQAIAVLAMSTAIISLFWRDNVATTILIAILSAVALWSWRGSLDIARFSVAFVVGPAMEIVCVYYGAWTYTNPILLIPPWLPFTWALIGIVIGRFGDIIEKRRSA